MVVWLLEVIGDPTLRDPGGPYLGFKFRLWVSTSQNFTIEQTKQKMQLVLTFLTKVVGKKTFLEVSSPLSTSVQVQWEHGHIF